MLQTACDIVVALHWLDSHENASVRTDRSLSPSSTLRRKLLQYASLGSSRYFITFLLRIYLGFSSSMGRFLYPAPLLPLQLSRADFYTMTSARPSISPMPVCVCVCTCIPSHARLGSCCVVLCCPSLPAPVTSGEFSIPDACLFPLSQRSSPFYILGEYIRDSQGPRFRKGRVSCVPRFMRERFVIAAVLNAVAVKPRRPLVG